MEIGMLNFWKGLLVTALTKETYFSKKTHLFELLYFRLHRSNFMQYAYNSHTVLKDYAYFTMNHTEVAINWISDILTKQLL